MAQKNESILKQAFKASNPFAIKRKIKFAKDHPDVLLNPLSILKKTPGAKKTTPGVNKIKPKTKTVKTASTKAAAVRRTLTILQRNVNTLLKEFKQMDALDAKIAKAAKSLRAKRKK